jgi:2-octaprenyl-6-methoxyphenol hydroxylase
VRLSHCDIAILGGGPVGAALALALDGGGHSVLLLETRDERSREHDPRTLALSHGSRLILEACGVWNDVTPAEPIRTIHVSHRGAFGRARLTADEAGLPALGYVVPYPALQRAMLAGLQRTASVTVLPGIRTIDLEIEPDAIRLQLDASRAAGDVLAKLAVIADGSALSQALSPVSIHDYGQSAVVANVAASKPHASTAFERFTPDGPLALLPQGSDYALVWTTAPDAAQQLCALDADAFLARLQGAFGERAGRFTAVQGRAVFPLALRVAEAPARGRTVLLGNAAQTLHPVAGQGLNLGLRDAWELAECVRSPARDPGNREVLASYARRRRRDRAAGIFLTNALVHVFSNDALPLRWLRGCGLTFLDSLPPIKRAFMQQMMFGRPF